MADFIQVNASPDRSTIEGIVVPESDGLFIINVTMDAAGNGNGTPEMWGEIFINGRSDKKTARIPWQNGPSSVKFSTGEPMKAGEQYDVRAVSGNSNADASGISMTINRV